MTNCFSC